MILLGFIIAQVLVFGVILIVLKKLIFQDTDSAINRLTRLDNLNREKEKKLSEKLEETDRLLREKMEQLAEEERRMKLEAERAANQLHDDIVKKARAEGDEVMKKAYATRDKIRSDAMIEAEGRMLDVCGELLSEILGPLAGKAINNELVEESLKELENIDTAVISGIKRAEILSAAPVGDEVIERVKKILSKKLDKEIDVKFREDKTLIAGIMMKFGTVVVDDSLRERLQTVSKKKKEDLTWKYRLKS